MTKGKYPAPLAILECAKTGLAEGHAAGSKKEAELFGDLSQTTESGALRGLFYGQTECKKNKYGKPAINVNTIAVLGAGLMGAGIAQVSATKGFRVLLKDRDSVGLCCGYFAPASKASARIQSYPAALPLHGQGPGARQTEDSTGRQVEDGVC